MSFGYPITVEGCRRNSVARSQVLRATNKSEPLVKVDFVYENRICCLSTVSDICHSLDGGSNPPSGMAQPFDHVYRDDDLDLRVRTPTDRTLYGP